MAKKKKRSALTKLVTEWQEIQERIQEVAGD